MINWFISGKCLWKKWHVASFTNSSNLYVYMIQAKKAKISIRSFEHPNITISYKSTDMDVMNRSILYRFIFIYTYSLYTVYSTRHTFKKRKKKMSFSSFIVYYVFEKNVEWSGWCARETKNSLRNSTIATYSIKSMMIIILFWHSFCLA